jgi:hypothetical protein
MKNERKTSSGLLAIFGVAIGILLLLTVVLVFVFSGKGTLPLLSPDTPEGTVQGYLLAIEDGDYLSAYNYLSSSMNLKPPYDQWESPFNVPLDNPAYKVTLGKINTGTSEATVEVIVEVFRPGSPFENPVRTNQITFFLKQEGIGWKISSPVDIWWLQY